MVRHRVTYVPASGCSPPRRPEPALAAPGLGQLARLYWLDLRKRCDQQLGDTVPGLDHERLGAVGVEQQDSDLAPVAGVDQARGVDEGDAVARREARSGQDQTGVSGRDLDRDAGAD